MRWTTVFTVIMMAFNSCAVQAEDAKVAPKDDTIRHHFKDKALSLALPKDWTAEETPEGTRTKIGARELVSHWSFEAYNNADQKAATESVLVTVNDEKKLKTADEYVDRFAKALEAEGAMRILKRETIDFGWTKATKAVVSENPDGHVAIGYFILHDGFIIYVGGYVSPKKWKEREQFFDSVAKTLQPEKKNASEKASK